MRWRGASSVADMRGCISTTMRSTPGTELSSWRPPTHSHGAASAAQLSQIQEAGRAFDKALALNPGDADALCGAASVAQRQSRPKVTDASSRTVPAAGGCSGPGAGDIVVAPIGTSSVKVVSSGGR